MRLTFGPLFALALITAILFATLYDLAAIAGQGLAPWLSWMFP